MASNAVVEMLECMQAETMTVLESWEARLKWQQQQQQQQRNTTPTATSNDIPVQGRHEFTLEAPFQRRNGQCMEEEVDHNHQGNFLGGEGLDANVWPELIQYPMLGDASSLDGFSSSVCPPVVGSAEKENMAAPLDAPAQKGVECSHGTDTVTTTATRCSHAHRKRKVGDAEAAVEKNACKRKNGGAVLLKQEMANPDTAIATKGSAKEERSCESSRNDATKASEVVQKSDYIHVRARRGQATDSHSLAERVRREKISERMKVLQNLVPGCDKITGKAGMLDEIINYVQSLQRQVEFLSMKLATLNLVLDFNRNGLIPATEKMAAVCGNGIPVATGAVSSQLTDTAFLPSNVTQTSLTANCALDLPFDLSQAALCRHLNEALPASDTLTNTCFDVHAAPYSWNAGLRTHHSKGRW